MSREDPACRRLRTRGPIPTNHTGSRFEAHRLRNKNGAQMDWLTVAEAAKEARVSEKTIRRWYRSGRLPVDRLGPRLVRVRRADLVQMGN